MSRKATVRHKYKGWHAMTHWDNRFIGLCGRAGIQRWIWARVTCKHCLKFKARREVTGE